MRHLLSKQWRPPGPAVAPIKPSPEALRRLNAALRWGGWLGRLAMRRWVTQVDVVGREHLSQGPLLLLMNHTCAADPVVLTAHARRPIQFLITEPVMSVAGVSRVASWCGQVPKRKLDADARSVRVLKEWCRVGGLVGLFPEGQFPWDGAPLALQPGLAQLVEYLDVPVVTLRLLNADRLWPPWAKHPRRTRLRLEVDPPRTFRPGEDIEAAISKSLRVDPDACARWPAVGEKLAEGLARFLRYCPSCGGDGTLLDSGELLRCASCQSGWTVTGENRLVGRDESMTIAQALGKVKAHWLQHSSRWPATRSRGPVNVIDISRRESAHLATGLLRLESRCLHVDDWRLGVEEIVAHTVDWGDRILLRTRRQRLALRMPEDSRALWTFALDQAIADAGQGPLKAGGAAR